MSRAPPSRSRLIRVNPPSAINLFLPPPPLLPAADRSSASLGTAGTHDVEYPSGRPTLLRGADNWRGGTVDRGAGERGFEGQTRTRVRSHRVARQTTDRRDDNIRDRGVKLCPGKRDNRSLRNCPPKSPSSSSSSNSSSSRFHNSSETSGIVASRNKSPPVARFADLHAKAPSLFASIILREKEENEAKMTNTRIYSKRQTFRLCLLQFQLLAVNFSKQVILPQIP